MERRSVEKKLSFFHFSHELALKLTNSPPKENIFCSACKLKISSGNKDCYNYYTCKTCPFFLHSVCHNMPRKMQHPAHPTHHLTLEISPSSSIDDALRCEVCGDHIHGFDYICSECSLHYHVLCLALPLSVSVSSHTHELKLTSSPPYNFSCDICCEPSYNGWLYRCQICKFDTHLLCAISNRRTQSFLNTLNGESTYSSSKTTSLGVRRLADQSSEVDEVMQLLTQALLCHNEESVNDQEIVEKNEAFILHSPKPNLNLKRTQFSVGPFDQTEAKTSPNPGQPFQHQNPLTAISEDNTSTIPSYQFSDEYFSIDLAKSYSRTKANDGQGTKGSGPEVEGTINKYKNTDLIHNSKLSTDFRQDQKQQSAYGNNGSGLINSLSMGRDERLMKEAFLVRSDTLTREELDKFKGKKSKANEAKGKSAISNQISRSDTDRFHGSSWHKILSCFCYTT